MGKIYRTTSFESVMFFQWRNDLWVSWPRDSFSTLTDLLDFIWLFAAKLCYRHMLKTAPEVKAKLGDDLEVFRPARWIASEAREFLEQQNSKDLFFEGKIPENSGFFDLSDIWQILIVYSFPSGHREMSTIRLIGFWPWCSYMFGQATGRLWRALGHCSGASCEPRALHLSPNVIMLLVHLHSLRRSCDILWWNSGKDLPWRRKQPSLFYRQRMWKLA